MECLKEEVIASIRTQYRTVVEMNVDECTLIIHYTGVTYRLLKWYYCDYEQFVLDVSYLEQFYMY